MLDEVKRRLFNCILFYQSALVSVAAAVSKCLWSGCDVLPRKEPRGYEKAGVSGTKWLRWVLRDLETFEQTRDGETRERKRKEKREVCRLIRLGYVCILC